MLSAFLCSNELIYKLSGDSNIRQTIYNQNLIILLTIKKTSPSRTSTKIISSIIEPDLRKKENLKFEIGQKNFIPFGVNASSKRCRR
jgi:hypothetical protein